MFGSAMIRTWEVAQQVPGEVHDRMPVILKPEQFDAWLDGSMGVDDIKDADR